MNLIANGPVRHDGEDIEEGATFDVKTKKQAEALIAAGSAHKPGSEDGSAAKGDPDAQNGVTGDSKTLQAAPVPTEPGPSGQTLKAAGKRRPELVDHQKDKA